MIFSIFNFTYKTPKRFLSIDRNSGLTIVPSCSLILIAAALVVVEVVVLVVYISSWEKVIDINSLIDYIKMDSKMMITSMKS